MSSTEKMPRPPNTFATGNKLLQKRWDQRAYRQHVQKMRGMKSGIDNKTPQNYLHLQLRLKKIQAEEERQATIEHENRILLAKLTQVLRSHGQVDNWNLEYEPRSLNRPHMERKLQQIEQENQEILARLNKVKSFYKPEQWEDEYILHQYYMGMKANETKDYEVYTAREDILEEIEDEDNKSDKQGSSGEESDHEEDGASSMKKEKTRELRKQHSRFPLLGPQRVKQEKKHKKEAAITKGQKYNEKEDAALLFKATKGMGNAPSAVVRGLARRKYKQRQLTKQRFEVQYELNLMEELNRKLGNSWNDMVNALLLEREEYDAMCINHALMGIGNSEATLIEIFCTRNNAALSAIKTAYSEKYDKDMMEDIQSDVSDPAFKDFLSALAKGIREEGGSIDQDEVEKDAQELLDLEPEERWKTNSGKFNEMLMDYSLSQLQAVLEEYAKLSDKKIIDVILEEFDGSMQDAMLALVKCLQNCPGFLTSRIRDCLTGAGDDTTLARIIVTRSEVDLPHIKKLYKKRYGHTLEEDLESKCKLNYKKALMEVVKVSGFAPKQNEQSNNVRKPGTMKLQAPPRWKPLRRPPPRNAKATVAADNPIMQTLKENKTGQKPKAPKKQAEKESRAETRETSETGSLRESEN
ncbi:annexin A7-like isoform X2 [Ptychodera flava]|uniref:annexin A7-like isoform X2 n=1 Tax=Ptychodera flava TaxID=63121 RepID=UPI00396A037E